MDPHLYWYLSGGFATVFSLLSVLFGLSMKNSARINKHDVVLAQVGNLPASLEKHEEREEKISHEINNKVDKLIVDVAIIKDHLKKNGSN